MSNSNDISVQTTSTSYTFQHPDGTEVTAQEVYDAFMSGLVILSRENGYKTLVVNIRWEDSAGVRVDPTDVVFVKILDLSGNTIFTIGSSNASS